MTSSTAPARVNITLLALLFAVAGGAAVGNLYWAQPLLTTIGADLSVGPSETSLLITVSQLGYALGVFFVVPLGDVLNRRRLIPAVMTLSALCLLASALAPTFAVLLITLALVGVTTVAGQLLTPLIGDIADDRQRGRAVGTVVSGILLGILVARTIGGVLAEAFDWRAVYYLAAAIMLAVALLMARFVPALPARAHVPYWSLIGSVYPTALRHRPARYLLALGATVMCVFTMFWTGLTFLLSSAPFNFGTSQIGLISLVGIAGAIAAQRAGALFDRGWSTPSIGIGLVVTLVALAISGFGSGALFAILLSVLVFSIGLQGAQVLLQTEMLSIDPAARSRLNTAFVVTNFAGGSLGSALAGPLWNAGGWSAIAIGGCVLIAVGLIVWSGYRAAKRRTA